MSCSRCDCAYLAVIVGIIAGVLLGVLFSFGLVSTGIIFWAYLAIGAAGIFLAPIYALLDSCCGGVKCFCNYRGILLLASAGTVIAAAAGLILAAVGTATVIAIVTGIATFFAVTLLATLICLTKCICSKN